MLSHLQLSTVTRCLKTFEGNWVDPLSHEPQAPSRRKSLAQCLSDPYVVESGKSESTELEGQDFIGSVSASCIEAALMWMPCRW